MIPIIFKPEQFFYNYEQKDIAPHAQSIFEAWLKENSKVVYAQEIEHHEHLWESKQHYPHTHQALLICIEEIKPKECEHEPISYMESASKGYCRLCGKKLRAKWSVVDE